jgi:PPK2 family polyphosphate:nucleotide phosphotransferase
VSRDADRWRVKPGARIDLAKIDTRDTAGAPGGKDEVTKLLGDANERLAELQERLYAEDKQSLLVALQAMDAGGKDGTVKHVFNGVNPQGVQVTAFKVPTDEELAHDFLWRVHKRTPARGTIGIFNRSHYEDVLVVRVHELVPENVWKGRYDLINAFEAGLAAAGTRIVKLFVHISKEEQAERFRERIGDPSKNWKFRAGDLAERARWDDYMAAYEDAIERTSTDAAPWYVVPSDRKWMRNWAVSRILIETLDDMDPKYPPPAEDLSGVVVE